MKGSEFDVALSKRSFIVQQGTSMLYVSRVRGKANVDRESRFSTDLDEPSTLELTCVPLVSSGRIVLPTHLQSADGTWRRCRPQRESILSPYLVGLSSAGALESPRNLGPSCNFTTSTRPIGCFQLRPRVLRWFPRSDIAPRTQATLWGMLHPCL
jgi:hypothetical protein